MTRLTEQEKLLIDYLSKGSNFNDDKLDFTKSFEEQHLEDEDCWMCLIDLKEFDKVLSMPHAAIRGLIGSMVKKELCFVMKDEDTNNYWLMIDKHSFNNIKESGII